MPKLLRARAPEDADQQKVYKLARSRHAPGDWIARARDSPPKDRTFIERFENYDDRLAEWHETSSEHRFFDSYTEPLDVLAETHMGDRFRGYNFEEEALLFGGDSYYLKPVADALEELAEAAQAQMNRPRFGMS